MIVDCVFMDCVWKETLPDINGDKFGDKFELIMSQVIIGPLCPILMMK
jgi:hypothetical protein